MAENNSPFSYTTSSFFPWSSLLTGSLQMETLEVILSIAHKLSDYNDVVERTTLLDGIYWQDVSVMSGFPSLSLFYLYLFRNTQDTQWFDLASLYIRLASNATVAHPLGHPSLAKGICGMATVLSHLSETDQRFEPHKQKLDRHLCRQILHYQWIKDIPEQSPRVSYDVITGASGVLGYLLTLQTQDALAQEAIHHLVKLLIQFIGMSPLHWFQRWFLPPIEGRPAQVNCGLAHGIPGPLVALALASKAGYTLSGQQEAIRCAAYWLKEHSIQTDWGIDWPDVFLSEAPQRPLQPARSAWCYGAPGILRSLWHASNVLQDNVLQDLVLQGLAALLQRPSETRCIDTLTLCHGASGLLLIYLHFWHETHLPLLQEKISLLVTEILQQFHPDHPFGFRYQFHSKQIDSPGLLSGACGTALALLASAGNEAPRWDRVLLLS